jgi:hypothetical protein
MNWEALSAIGTAVTALIFLATVVLGARQLRATNDQLAHLRRATQLDGTMRIFEALRSERVSGAVQFVMAELEDRLKDDAYRREAEKPGGVDATTHKERIVFNAFEEVGTYVRHGLVNGSVIYDFYSSVIIGCWRRMAPLVEAQRAIYGDDQLWSNFEFLCQGSKAWEEAHPGNPVPPRPDLGALDNGSR